MKKWFKEVKDWFDWNGETVITIAVVVLLIAALVVALVIGINASNNGDGMNKEVAWLINPANPASPVHTLP